MYRLVYKSRSALTVDWDVAIKTWLQIGESVSRAGIKRLAIITSHGGNVPPMEIVARELRQKHGMSVATTAWGRLNLRGSVHHYEGVMTDIHGGLSETSLMLAMRPDLVDMSKAENFASAQTALVQGTQQLGFHMRNANIAWVSGDLHPKGTVGDASTASAAAVRGMLWASRP